MIPMVLYVAQFALGIVCIFVWNENKNRSNFLSYSGYCIEIGGV